MKRRPSEAYLTHVRALSDRIVAAQKPIRVLDAIKWDQALRESFFRSRGRSLPKVDVQWYRDNNPLGFDPEAVKTAFYQIERDISRFLGQMNPLTQIMRRTCREYIAVVRMLEARGTPAFGLLSQELYGSASDVFHAGDPCIAELGVMMEGTLAALLRRGEMQEAPKRYSAQEEVDILNERLSRLFPGEGIRVMLSDGITGDAAAGTDYLKIREDARFSDEDLDFLEVHEGWVHLGTTFNGGRQPYCTFLSKGPPSVTVTQEGLAVLTEILTLRATPARLARLIYRVRAITLAEEGADLVVVYRYLRDLGCSREDAWTICVRVFRGSVPDGLPFTKDLVYIKGFVLTYNFLRLAFANGAVERLPLLFCGKVVLEDIGVLAHLAEEGVIAPPAFVPPYMRDLKGLASWMSFARFIGGLNFAQLEADYRHLLR